VSETALSKAIRTALEQRGLWVIRVQSGVIPAVYKGRRRHIHCAEPGTPDLFVVDRGVWLEVKPARGKLRPEQRAWHEKAARCFVRVVVVRSVREALAALGLLPAVRRAA